MTNLLSKLTSLRTDARAQASVVITSSSSSHESSRVEKLPLGCGEWVFFSRIVGGDLSAAAGVLGRQASAEAGTFHIRPRRS